MVWLSRVLLYHKLAGLEIGNLKAFSIDIFESLWHARKEIVDASKGMVTWAKENAELSALKDAFCEEQRGDSMIPVYSYRVISNPELLEEYRANNGMKAFHV